MTRRRRGFTLVELLVVIAILVLLVSILLPSLRQAREYARIAVCCSNMRGVSIAFGTYSEQYEGMYLAPWERTKLPPANLNRRV